MLEGIKKNCGDYWNFNNKKKAFCRLCLMIDEVFFGVHYRWLGEDLKLCHGRIKDVQNSARMTEISKVQIKKTSSSK